MKTNRFYLSLSLQIAAIFSIVILTSVLPDYLHDFFGDVLCNGTMVNIETGKSEYFYHYGSKHQHVIYHWGYRHWLWFFMGLILFIIQAVRIVEFCNRRKEEA